MRGNSGSDRMQVTGDSATTAEKENNGEGFVNGTSRVKCVCGVCVSVYSQRSKLPPPDAQRQSAVNLR